MLLLLSTLGWPHGGSFGATAVSVDPGDADRIWVLTEGWGLARSTDGGARWSWLCEEALGGAELYDVLALGPDEALVGTREGLRTVDDGCGSRVITGTESAFFLALERWGSEVLALGTGADLGGVWRCEAGGSCVLTPLAGAGMFPKSVVVDGVRAWVTVVYEDTLASELWWTEDGERWTLAHAWPDGDTDPRVLRADGDDLLVWRRTRDASDTPELLRSTDGGSHFTSVLQAGAYGEAAPALLQLEGALLLGSIAGARTWRSEDAGASWTEVSAEVPAVRCGDTVDGTGFACADHLQDGIDLARTTDGRTWTPIACLEEAVPAECAEATCAPLADAYAAAGAFGGGRCDSVITPAEVAEEAGCGCASGPASAAWSMGAVLAVLLRVRARQRRPRGVEPGALRGAGPPPQKLRM
jgi:MYXO-CTERM domain-containing protein